jgi:hypothetical protein
MFAGAGAAGAVAAVASLIPTPSQDKPGADTAPDRPAPTRGGGYSLSEHVKQYYKTTRI